MAYTVQFHCRAHFWGLVGKFSSTIEIALVFLECVRDEGATDQMVVGDKVARISNCISPDNSTIQAEKIVWSRPMDYVPFAFLMPGIVPLDMTARPEVVMHI